MVIGGDPRATFFDLKDFMKATYMFGAGDVGIETAPDVYLTGCARR